MVRLVLLRHEVFDRHPDVRVQEQYQRLRQVKRR
jgi:hypothetical protein